MPSYLSPGVYVEEIPSAVQAIAGVGTSTAGFIGILANNPVTVPTPSPFYNPAKKNDETVKVTLVVSDDAPVSLVGVTKTDGKIVETLNQAKTLFNGGTDVADSDPPAKTVEILNAPSKSLKFTIKDENIGEPKLCTNFSDFRKFFGDFSTDQAHSRLAHAVFGFFHNGGTRGYVAVVKTFDKLDDLLKKLGAVDEIAIVVAPGLSDEDLKIENIAAVRDKIVAHCKVDTQDRFAILDGQEEVQDDDGNVDSELLKPDNDDKIIPDNSDYAAFYFPWIQVFDPATKILDPKGSGRSYVPPGGHMAGIYARVDTNRGVHKAPANEPVLGALDLKYNISKSMQDGLNPQGVNCIRDLNGNIRVWGARTIGGDANGEWRYINVRRVFLFLRESIDEGTQWVVFEPNDEKLWAKITRNVSAFLTTVWRSGALFGSTAAEAFYVKCDAETNPPELREVGQVVTEIGVAVVRPAEFVIFRISQWQPETS